MFTNTASYGTSVIVLGAMGLLATDAAFARSHQDQLASKPTATSAEKKSTEGTGKGVWIHPTGPTGSFYGQLYDASGNLQFVMEGGLTKVPGFESLDGPQFGYMDGNLYATSELGPFALVARVEGQWEKAPNADGRFLAEIIEATETANPASLGLIEGEFRFRQAMPVDGQKLNESPQAVLVLDGAGANRPASGSAVGNDGDSKRDRVSGIGMVPKERADGAESAFRAERTRGARKSDYQSAAGRTGISKTLDRWAILHAIKKVAEATKKGRKVEIIVPLSVESVMDPKLAVWMSDCITKSKIDARSLVFMINEGEAVNQLKATKTLYKGIKQMKCKFALDEFGTGLNPFQLVKHIKADYIRINVAYVDNLAQSPENQDSIREIATQAAEMGINSITPGVEDAAILSLFWTLNVDFVQGDFLQTPDKSLNYDFSSM